MSKKLPPVHPGEILLEEYLKPLALSQYRLAKAIHVPPRRINEIVHGKRSVTVDTALRLSRFFETSERFWLNLQTRYDLEVEKDRLGDKLRQEIMPYKGAALLLLDDIDEESLKLSTDRTFMRIIRTAREEAARGKVLSLEEMKREML